jgi:hypothetical protein
MAEAIGYRQQADRELQILRAVESVAKGDLQATEEQRLTLYSPLGFGSTGPLASDAGTPGTPAANLGLIYEHILNLQSLIWQTIDYRNRVNNWAMNYPYDKKPFPAEPEVITNYRAAWAKVLGS